MRVYTFHNRRFRGMIIAACITVILVMVYKYSKVTEESLPAKGLTAPLNRRERFANKLYYTSNEYDTPNFPLVVEVVHRVIQEQALKTALASSHSSRKKMVWFNAPEWMRSEAYNDFSGCKVSDCVMSENKRDLPSADLVLVHADLLDDIDVPGSNPDQLYLFYSAETPYLWHNPRTYGTKDWNSRFNWTLSYRLDSDFLSPYSRLILKDQQADITNYTDIVLKKTKSVVWFVSHCSTQSRREEYVNELRKHIPVDIYGKCGSLSCEGRECDDVKNKYRFYLSFENSMCKDYVTEKFFNTFQHNMISIVRGGADYSKLFPKDVYINTADFPSPKHLAEHLKALEKDVPAMTERVRTIGKYNTGGNTLTGMTFICDLCEKLHQPIVQKYYPDIHKWWAEDVCVPPRDL